MVAALAEMVLSVEAGRLVRAAPAQGAVVWARPKAAREAEDPQHLAPAG